MHIPDYWSLETIRLKHSEDPTFPNSFPSFLVPFRFSPFPPSTSTLRLPKIQLCGLGIAIHCQWRVGFSDSQLYTEVETVNPKPSLIVVMVQTQLKSRDRGAQVQDQRRCQCP